MNGFIEIKNKIRFIAFAVLFFLANYRYAFLNASDFELPPMADLFVMGAIVLCMAVLLLSAGFEVWRKYWLYAVFLLVPAVIVFLFTKEKVIVLSAVGILCAYGFKPRRIVLTDLICKAAVLFQSVVLTLFRVLSDTVYEESFLGIGYKAHSLGFINANSPAIIMTMIFIEYCFLFGLHFPKSGEDLRDKRTLRDIGMLILCVLTLFVCGNKTIIIIAAVTVIVYLSRKVRTILSGPFIPAVIAVFVVCCCVFHNGYGLFSKIDNIFLNGRFFQACGFFRIYGVKLFGQPIEMFGHTFFDSPITLDCFYSRMLINYGIIYFLLYLFAMFMLFAKTKEKGGEENKNARVLLFAVTVAGVMESNYYILWMNPAMLLLPELVFGNFSVRDAWQVVEERAVAFAARISKKLLPKKNGLQER